jgi:glucose-6-phosphate-specific signal transduction histidine kinase
MDNAGSAESLRDAVNRLQDEVAELRGSRKRLVQAAHDDRRSIERALHDGVQQHIIAFAVQLRRLTGLVDNDPAAAKALLDEMLRTCGRRWTKRRSWRRGSIRRCLKRVGSPAR